MKKKRSLGEKYISFILSHRFWVLVVVGVITAFFGFKIYSLKIATDFFTLYPPKHAHIELYNEYREMFGTANVLMCAVEVKEGDIYNTKTITKIDRITTSIMEMDGVNPVQVASITHPRVKQVDVSSHGVQVRPLMYPPKIPATKEELDVFKRAIYENSGIRGFYVASDDKSATVFAGFWEEGVDPARLYKDLEKLKNREADENTNIHFCGVPALYAHVYHFAPQVYLILGITVLVMVSLLYFYFRSLRGVLLPTLSAGMSAIWGIGFASALGIALDPLIIVVPLIITARALSHSVQTLVRYHEEYGRVQDKNGAIVKSYSDLLTPGTLSIITDAVGVLLIAVATIPLMRNLAFFCSFWIVSIFVSVLTFNPVLLSFLRPPRNGQQFEHDFGGRFCGGLARVLVKTSMGNARWITVATMVLVLTAGIHYSLKLKIGNTEPGAAILFEDHPYNESSRFFNSKFVGANQLVIIAEGKKEGALKDPKGLMVLEDFQRYMASEGGAKGTLTITNLVKRIYRMFMEGNPKWERIPNVPKHIGEIAFMISASSAPGEMDRWVDNTWTNATITCFYNDYSNDLIKKSLAKAKEFMATRLTEEDPISLRLAAGFLGIQAAVNEEVEYSYWASLMAVFIAVFALWIAAFRSVKVALALVLPLAVSQALSDTFMLYKGIDLNINSLPVAATAIGIGVDYGIYLMSRIGQEYRTCQNYDIAIRRSLETTGKAIAFTATTLVAGVIFWSFSSLKFQAEMGLLLGLLMFLNMVNALILVPALCKVFKPKFIEKELNILKMCKIETQSARSLIKRTIFPKGRGNTFIINADKSHNLKL